MKFFLKLSFLSPFFFISVCSHDFIGEFSTSYRELSRGQSQFNVYEVSFSCMYRNVSVFKFKTEAPMETSVQVLQCVLVVFFCLEPFCWSLTCVWCHDTKNVISSNPRTFTAFSMHNFVLQKIHWTLNNVNSKKEKQLYRTESVNVLPSILLIVLQDITLVTLC